MIGNVAWAWAKTGIVESDFAEAYSSYVSDEGLMEGRENVYDNEEKPMPELKDEEKVFEQHVLINRTRPEVCDQEVKSRDLFRAIFQVRFRGFSTIFSYFQMYLYLRNSSFNTYDVEVDKDCVRPYVVQPVNFSNMLLLVVNTDCGDTTSPALSVIPEEVIYENNTLVCQKALFALKRKRPQSCIRSHPRESEIKDQCGTATTNELSTILLVKTLLLTYLLSRHTRLALPFSC